MTEHEIIKRIIENINTRIDAHVAIVAKTSNKHKKHMAFSIAAELADLKDDIERNIKNDQQ